MRKFIFAFLGILVLASCNHSGRLPGSFTISGHISGMDSGQIVITHHINSRMIKQDTLQMMQGNFHFSGQVTEPTVYYLSVSDTINPLMVFVDSGQMTIYGERDSLEDARVTGSTTENAYLDYEQQMKPFRDLTDSLDLSYETAEKKGETRQLDSLNNVYDTIEHNQQKAIMTYVKANPGSLIGAWAVTQNFLYNPDIGILSGLYHSLDSAIRSTSYGRLIDRSLIIARKVALGQVAPDFTEKDPQGKPVSLSSLRGKYVLVDFWASWCGPCRAENPNVVKAYRQFKDKGFTILGVSLDKNKDSWVQAIKQDHLDWNQVSDLKFWNNRVAKLYGIRAIPSNFLLDRDGKILARNLRGKKLDQELAMLFR